MIYECTDCKHCANFDFGFRVFCLNPTLPSDEVCKFHPVGHWDAQNCVGFDEEYAPELDFSMKDFIECEKWCEETYGDVTYDGVKEWCERKLGGNL